MVVASGEEGNKRMREGEHLKFTWLLFYLYKIFLCKDENVN